MKIIDISTLIEPDMQVYKNKQEKRPQIGVAAIIPQNGVRETALSFNLHTGTHIDAPSHILEGGAFTEDYDLEKFFVPAVVLDFSSKKGLIELEDLEAKDIPFNHFVIIKSVNSIERNFSQEFAFVSVAGLDYLAKRGSLGIGIDASGVEFGQAGHPGHRLLFANNMIILEGLDLLDVDEGRYILNFFPIKITKSDAAPVRAVLIDDSNLYLTLLNSSGDNE
ncbi:MAG: cyclase family protein [Spirochaetales bacterium]|nr:cyclase family protein [Spirochaetales bacterium]